MQFCADADIFMATHLRKLRNSYACNVNQWYFYNSTADTDIQLYKYQSSLYISNNMSDMSDMIQTYNAIQSNDDWEKTK